MIKPGSWLVCYGPSFPSIQYVVPTDDDIVHEAGIHCECNPRKELQHMGMHIVAVQIVHNAQDGRE